MSIEIVNFKACTGCGACAQRCPQNCISMVRDTEGFVRPCIDKQKCIKCEQCETACQILYPISADDRIPVSFACNARRDNIRDNTSSGGIFPLLAEYHIHMGGVVTGAAFDENCRVRHIIAKDIIALRAFYGSKYVQSEIGECYKEAEKYLKDNISVLFSGTPCQIEGLKCYLGEDYDNLITVGLACHGVPSPKAWEKYLQKMEHEYDSKITEVYFRDKRYGWKNYALSILFDNGREYCSTFEKDPYMLSFLLNYSLRNCCYHCRYKGMHRNSDITLADFWGIEKELPEMDDNKGTSLVLLQTEKGERIFHSIFDEICCQTTNTVQALEHNGGLSVPADTPIKRDIFFDVLENSTLEDAYREAARLTIRERIEVKIGRLPRR